MSHKVNFQNEDRGSPCSYCGSHTRVSDSRWTQNKGIRRVRKCAHGHQYTTYEITKEEYDRLTGEPKLQQEIDELKTALRVLTRLVEENRHDQDRVTTTAL